MPWSPEYYPNENAKLAVSSIGLAVLDNMGWRDLIQTDEARIVSPWVGGRTLRHGPRSWSISGPLPHEYGWYAFALRGRYARLGDEFDDEIAREACVAPPGPLYFAGNDFGYLVGDRLIADGARIDPDPKHISRFASPVFLLESGLDRFCRISAGRTHEGGPLIFEAQEMPLGPENDVLSAFLDGATSVSHIKGISPALDAAFRMELWQRQEAERVRRELEERRVIEEQERQREQTRQRLVQQMGHGAGRREMALIDFGAAARSALQAGGAEYLDHRTAHRPHEVVVRYRMLGRRFECVCDSRTFRIIDAGVCLTAHNDGDGYAEGTRGDSWFTLESLPGVIRQADAEGKLVVFRHGV